ncbi:DUF4412 domain-containing protein [Algoriphagus taiwanensis]|uniref:DUF4412 domain-containing protein n=1 Tax=Algoriphagus taiwanensis TaxID=1445656 RepID=A0ABQ6PXE4_9BACT|nr:hypothetical protein Ataiwa_08930 [Algoriphagus taiwanensis]
MKKLILICTIAGITTVLPAQAQLLKKIQNAAQNAAQSTTTPKNEKEGKSPMEGLLGGMMQAADTESSYDFTGYMVMEVTSINKKGKADPPSRINYLLTDNTDFMGMSFADPKTPENITTTIMDVKNQAMVILMDNEGQKTSIAMKVDYDKIQEMVDEEADGQMEEENYSVTKTGNKKDILGYTCEEYLVKSEDGQGNYWVTEEPIEGFSMFSPQSNPMISNKTVEKYQSFFSSAPKGTFLEMIFTDNNGEVTDMKVVEIQTSSPKKFNMSSYPNAMSGMN